MQSSEDDAKPTKEEVFRDFRVFRLNHRDEERLFRHDIFTDIISQVYDIPSKRLTDMKQIDQVILGHPLPHFISVLRQCISHLRGRTAKQDLHAVLSYAKEAL